MGYERGRQKCYGCWFLPTSAPPSGMTMNDDIGTEMKIERAANIQRKQGKTGIWKLTDNKKKCVKEINGGKKRKTRRKMKTN